MEGRLPAFVTPADVVQAAGWRTGKVRNISDATSTASIHSKFIDKSGEVEATVNGGSKLLIFAGQEGVINEKAVSPDTADVLSAPS
jgi:hypothetical protein